MTWLRLSILCFAIPSCPSLTLAQADPSVARFDEGVEHLREGRHAEAAAAFRESYRLEARAATMCNLALTYDRWGPEHHAQAVRAYRTCARDDDSGRFRAFAERRVVELERDLVLEEPEAQAEPALDAVVAPAPPSPDHGLLFAGLGTGGLAIGAFIAGAVLALDAQAGLDALVRDLGPAPVVVSGSPEHGRLSSARASATAAVALYVVAGVALAASIALVLIDLVLASSSPSPVALVPSPDGLALSLAF